jgi:hypothetical protein
VVVCIDNRYSIVFNKAPDPDWTPFSQFSGSKRVKMTYKNRKKLRNFMFFCAGCSLFLWVEGFPVAWKFFMEARDE